MENNKVSKYSTEMNGDKKITSIHYVTLPSVIKLIDSSSDIIKKERKNLAIKIPTIDQIRDGASAIIVEHFAAFSLGALFSLTGILMGNLLKKYWCMSYKLFSFGKGKESSGPMSKGNDDMNTDNFDESHDDNDSSLEYYSLSMLSDEKNNIEPNNNCITRGGSRPSLGLKQISQILSCSSLSDGSGKSLVFLSEIAPPLPNNKNIFHSTMSCWSSECKKCIDNLSIKLSKRNLSWDNVIEVAAYLVAFDNKRKNYDKEFRSLLNMHIQENDKIHIIFMKRLENDAIAQIELTATD